MNDTAKTPQRVSWETADQRFVQDRLALFGKTIFCISMTFITISTVFAVIGTKDFVDRGRESDFATTVIALTVWLLARRRTTLSPPALFLLDGAGTLGMCLGVALMGHFSLEAQPWGFFASTLAVLHVAVARAVVVPSSARRTFVVTALSFAALVVTSQFLPGTDAPWSTARRWTALIMPLAWSSTASALATLASSVIYGLRKEVVKARQLGQYTSRRRSARVEWARCTARVTPSCAGRPRSSCSPATCPPSTCVASSRKCS